MSELVKKDISKPLAVITGATGGLGEIFARLLAQRGFDLLLVGRNREKLESLAALLNKNFKVSASPIVSDLSSETELRKLCTFLKTLPQTPHVLINNAGFGFVGNALSMAPEKAQEMINVNVKALTALTLALAPQMKEKGVGRILNVASIAAFMPCPTMAVYAGTKAYVLSFSEALNTELKGTGVTVLGKVSLPASAQGGFGLDTDYVYVRANVDGQTVYGYLPLGYTVENSASSGGLNADEFVYRNVKKGESITLWMGELSLTLSDRERVKMYGEPNEEGEVYVTYTDASGTWSGYVPEDCLYEAPSSATITLVIILLVTAAVLASGCYLLLRKPPMLQE